MNIIANIKEISDQLLPIIDTFVLYLGVLIFVFWLISTSFGTKALINSLPRRNNMPVALPLILFISIFMFIVLISGFSEQLLDYLPEWQQTFINLIIDCITRLFIIAVTLVFVKKYFVRGLKGFGLRIKTVPKDFVAAAVSLIAIMPILNIVFIITEIFYTYINGTDIPKHEALESMVANDNLPVRIAISLMAVGITPFFEEILFRGLFQTMIRSVLNQYRHAAWIAIILTSIFFTINHANASHWPTLFTLSMCLGYSYEKSGSLFRSIFLHMFFNGSAVILNLLQ